MCNCWFGFLPGQQPPAGDYVYCSSQQDRALGKCLGVLGICFLCCVPACTRQAWALPLDRQSSPSLKSQMEQLGMTWNPVLTGFPAGDLPKVRPEKPFSSYTHWVCTGPANETCFENHRVSETAGWVQGKAGPVFLDPGRFLSFPLLESQIPHSFVPRNPPESLKEALLWNGPWPGSCVDSGALGVPCNYHQYLLGY